jgi:hypothetical protein
MGAVPVRRRMDHSSEEALDNEDAFKALHDILLKGHCVGIFPEGISHSQSQLSTLKTGAARIALGAIERCSDRPIYIVPCGLNYTQRNRFRSSVLVQFGAPILLESNRLPVPEEDEKQLAVSRSWTVEGLTTRIDGDLRALTVNADSWDTVRVLDAVRRIYQPRGISLYERVELSRRFNHHYPSVRDKPEVIELFSRIKGYLEGLDELGLEDREIVDSMSQVRWALKVFESTIMIIFWAPIGAIGVILHLPIALLLGWASERWAPRKDVVATTKFIAGVLLLKTLYSTAFLSVGYFWGWGVGVLLLFAVSFAGYASIRLIERYQSVSQLFTRAIKMVVYQREVGSLRYQRGLLKVAIEDIIEGYKPKDMILMFPPEAREEFC